MMRAQEIARYDRGQSILVFSLFIIVFVLLSIGLYSFELNRLEVGRIQLRSACEAAALAAAATLASQDNVDSVAAHTQAVHTALTHFQHNSVLGVPLSEAILAAGFDDMPGPNMSSIFVEFLDPNNNNQSVPLGDPRGKLVKISGFFGLQPAFGQYLGIGHVPIVSQASGGVPDLDVVLCFDVSGSIDDQTLVTFVKRRWQGDAATGRMQYDVLPTRPGSPAGARAEGRIYDIIGPQPTGSGLQGIPPQGLGAADDSVRWPLRFSETVSASRGLRGRNNTGSPPGNHPTSSIGNGAGTGDQYTFTDVIVNIDGRQTFQSYTAPGGYAFPDLATVVEAARGNLESTAVFNSSLANRSVPASVTPRAGYRTAYLNRARDCLQPIGEARIAAQEFFTIMNTNTRARFGMICFSSNAGTSSSTTYAAPNVDSNYASGGNGNFPQFAISLSTDPLSTNYTEIMNAVPTTVATGGTNIGDALNAAVNQLNSRGRAGAKKAIVLFTDGMPQTGGPLHSDPQRNCRMAAQNARARGIPIYSIGLAQNPEIIPGETAILNDTNSNPTTGGVSGIAGNGGKFFLVTNSADLRATFENIARHLVQLVR